MDSMSHVLNPCWVALKTITPIWINFRMFLNKALLYVNYWTIPWIGWQIVHFKFIVSRYMQTRTKAECLSLYANRTNCRWFAHQPDFHCFRLICTHHSWFQKLETGARTKVEGREKTKDVMIFNIIMQKTNEKKNCMYFCLCSRLVIIGQHEMMRKLDRCRFNWQLFIINDCCTIKEIRLNVFKQQQQEPENPPHTFWSWRLCWGLLYWRGKNMHVSFIWCKSPMLTKHFSWHWSVLSISVKAPSEARDGPFGYMPNYPQYPNGSTPTSMVSGVMQRKYCSLYCCTLRCAAPGWTLQMLIVTRV